MTARGRPRGFDRERALRQAMLHFWEHGYDGTSVSDLTTAMQIRSPSLYAAFDCKEALFREAVDHYTRTEGTGADDALRDAPSAREGIEAMLRDKADNFTADGKPRGCMISLAGFTYTAASAEVRDFLAEHRRLMQSEIQQRFDRGVTDGDLAADADTEAMAEYFATVVHGLSIRARDGATRSTLHQTIDRAMQAWPERRS